MSALDSIDLRSARIAVVGAGAAGLTLACLLASSGLDVEVLEASAAAPAGAGITLQANALRVLRSAGVWEAIAEAGYGFDSTAVRLPTPDAKLLAELTEGRFALDLPATLGMQRADLARILSDRAIQCGAILRRGVRVRGLCENREGVELDLVSEGGPATERFDLVVGADGVNSTVRRLIGITIEPGRIPLGVWRFTAPRPASVTRLEVVNGGSAYFAGFAPTGRASLYGYLVEDAADRRGLEPRQRAEIVRGLAAGYHGVWDEIRASIADDGEFNYTVYSEMLVPLPWHQGRVVLIGDAVHVCPPTMAQGAAQSLEDAAVLAEVLSHGSVRDTDLVAFGERRMRRVRPVIDGSVQMARWQLAHDFGDVGGLMRSTSRMLAEPA